MPVIAFFSRRPGDLMEGLTELGKTAVGCGTAGAEVGTETAEAETFACDAMNLNTATTKF